MKRTLTSRFYSLIAFRITELMQTWLRHTQRRSTTREGHMRGIVLCIAMLSITLGRGGAGGANQVFDLAAGLATRPGNPPPPASLGWKRRYWWCGRLPRTS